MTEPVPDAFENYIKGMISALQKELALYRDGTAQAGRRTGGEWADITQARILQIEQEITALEHAVARHKRT